MPSKTITYNDIELVVEYIKFGKYMPATAWNPEEFPDVTITAIKVADVDIKPIVGELYQDEIYDILFSMIMDEEPI